MTDTSFPFQPVVIIGAGRSGTNILRDTLTSLSGVATWPCDEINPIWRHGNIGWPTDEIPATRATPVVKTFIRGQFQTLWQKSGQPQFVVEKTCANALRVPFVSAVLPEAKFVHLVRHGLDVAPSARKRWRGELEMSGLPYFMAKAKYVPKRDLPIYLKRFVTARLRKLVTREQRLGTWGPHFDGMSDLGDLPLMDVCLRQWAACVAAADAAFAQIDPARVLTLRYEDFLQDPTRQLGRVTQFIGHDASTTMLAQAVTSVRPPSGKPRKDMTAELLPATLAAAQPSLSHHGYHI